MIMKIYRIGIHDKGFVFSKNSENRTVYGKKRDLMTIKCKIDTCDSKKWEEVKKKYNLYEFIYTSSKQTQKAHYLLLSPSQPQLLESLTK